MKLSAKVSLAGLAVLVAAAAVSARVMRIVPPAMPICVARADVVVTGKVTKIEDKTVSALAVPGAKDKAEYQIAVVKVDDPILNAKGITEIRVGFIPPQPVQPGGGVRPIRPRIQPATLSENEEVCLFLTKHFDADFYTMPTINNAIKKANNDNFDKDVAEAKKCGKLLADSMTSLKSKQAEERFQTAAMLIERYRTQKPPFVNPPKQEPIDAVESKLILEALRDADWTPPKPPTGPLPRVQQLTPWTTFLRLALTPDDNWTPPTDGKYLEAAQAWLKDNAGTYRIKKFVAEEKKDKKD
jgi:hypothetical protein